jgi:hypothetical protein
MGRSRKSVTTVAAGASGWPVRMSATAFRTAGFDMAAPARSGSASRAKRKHTPRERNLQAQCVAHLRKLKTKGKLQFAPIPNGAVVAGKTKLDRAIRVKRMKDDGQLEPGALDLIIALRGGATIWAEAKAGKGQTSKEQREFIALLEKLGHRHFVFRSLDEFVERLHDEMARAAALSEVAPC